MTDVYDQLPYSNFPYPQTHPDRLATVATLHGLEAPPPRGCRVLELGCGAGGNLIGLAYADRAGRFVGLDLARTAIAQGRATAEALGLENVELHPRDLTELGRGELGEFDFAIAHGVYSWVPQEVRDALLVAIRSHLVPGGIAFVSYNARPGGVFRRLLGEAGAWHAGRAATPAARAAAARELYAFLLDNRAAEDDPYGATLQRELPRLLQRSDPSLVHDELGDFSEPVWLHRFVEHAAAHGLTFVGEAQFGELHAERLPPGVEHALTRFVGPGADRVAVAQYEDLLLGRKFRQTVLCAGACEPASEPAPDAVRRLRWAAPPGPVQASAAGLELRALDVLGAVWPRALGFEELRSHLGAGGGELAAAVLAAFRAGRAGPRTDPPEHAAEPGERPRASALARLQAQAGPDVTSLRHENVRIEEPAARRLLVLLDGARDRAQVLADLAAAPDGARMSAEDLDGNLRQLAALALLHE